jgi:hypothetical protein
MATKGSSRQKAECGRRRQNADDDRRLLEAEDGLREKAEESWQKKVGRRRKVGDRRQMTAEGEKTRSRSEYG